MVVADTFGAENPSQASASSLTPQAATARLPGEGSEETRVPTLSQAEKPSPRHQVAAHEPWTRDDVIQGTAAPRAAGPAATVHFENMVDPNQLLPEPERQR